MQQTLRVVQDQGGVGGRPEEQVPEVLASRCAGAAPATTEAERVALDAMPRLPDSGSRHAGGRPPDDADDASLSLTR